MKNNKKFSDLVSCSVQDLTDTLALHYKPQDGGDWKSVDLDLAVDSVKIPGTDPCKEYQLKIKVNEDEGILPNFGNYNSNEAATKSKGAKAISMANGVPYYENNFKPTFSAVNDNELKISWADFCLPTTVDVFNADGVDQICFKADMECIIPSEPCKHYGFWLDVESDVLGKQHNMPEQYFDRQFLED